MKRAAASIIAGLLSAACAAQITCNPNPLLVWNVTASAPVGLYRRSFLSLARGDWVLVKAPEWVRRLAADRRYVPANVPMVKRIAAVAGDTVCRFNTVVTVNGYVRAIARMRDNNGRPLPVWQGCKVLKPDQIFVLTAPAASFDGRYFGLLARQNIVERIAPLWTC
jgi:conjugative transfer signal peptidase TraF